MTPVPFLFGGGGKPVPKEWLRGGARQRPAVSAKSKRRVANKRARSARRVGR